MANLYRGQPGTSDTVILTAASNGVGVSAIYAENLTGAAVPLTITLHRAGSGNVETIVNAVSIGVNTLQPVTPPHLASPAGLVLYLGDTIHATCGTASAVTVTLMP